MSAALHLAGAGDLPRLLPMVAAAHAEAGRDTTPEAQESALAPLLDGSPYGAVYLIGPKSAPVGFVAVTFGWSIASGGMDCTVDEFWIRPNVRGRGMGSEVLTALLPRLETAGVTAIHREVADDDASARRFFGRHRFGLRDGYLRMTRTARR